jgi:hypothetical protein
MTAPELVAAINDVERRVREVAPVARPTYIEPDIYSEGPAEEAPRGGRSPDPRNQQL